MWRYCSHNPDTGLWDTEVPMPCVFSSDSVPVPGKTESVGSYLTETEAHAAVTQFFQSRPFSRHAHFGGLPRQKHSQDEATIRALRLRVACLEKRLKLQSGGAPPAMADMKAEHEEDDDDEDHL